MISIKHTIYNFFLYSIVYKTENRIEKSLLEKSYGVFLIGYLELKHPVECEC